MALQASGPIKLSEVQTEFGGSNPISISEYYGVDTVPASGVIKLSNFYGTVNETVISRDAFFAAASIFDENFTSLMTGAGFTGGILNRSQITYDHDVGPKTFGTGRIRFTNLFNIAGVSAADAGRLLVWKAASQNPNEGSDIIDDGGTTGAVVTCRWKGTVSGTTSISHDINGVTSSTVQELTSTITSDNNGTAIFDLEVSGGGGYTNGYSRLGFADLTNFLHIR